MKYKLVQRTNPQDKTAPAKWYANAVNEGKIGKREISCEIAGRSSLTSGDVFGTLRLSLASEGAETPEKFNSGMISKVKVVFTPGVDLKKAIENVPFERVE